MLTRKNFWIIASNSTAGFVLSYLIIFYLNQLSFVLTAGMYDYPVSIDYASYYFHIEPFQWTHDAVFLIFSSGYVITLIFGFLSLLAFFQLIADAIPVKVFFFWFTMHASNYVFGGLMLGNLLTEGIGHVFNWMYLLDTPRMIISLIGFFGLLITALFASRLVSISANAYFDKYNERNAPFFITAQVLVPYFIGSVLIFIYFLPKSMFHEKFGWIVLGTMLFIFFLRSRFTEDLMFEEDDQRKIRLMKGFLLFTFFTYLLTRILFHRSIMFYA